MSFFNLSTNVVLQPCVMDMEMIELRLVVDKNTKLIFGDTIYFLNRLGPLIQHLSEEGEMSCRQVTQTRHSVLLEYAKTVEIRNALMLVPFLTWDRQGRWMRAPPKAISSQEAL